MLPFTRYLTAVRSALAFLSGLMIAAVGAMTIQLWLDSQITLPERNAQAWK